MKIVFQHSGILPVLKYGGIERILFWHMRELAKRGHEVILFGHPDSKVEEFGIKLIPMPQSLDDFEKNIPSDVDILHLTYSYKLKNRDIPTLINIQGNGQINEKFPLNTVFVSKKHANNHGSECFVYNAVDLSEYPYEDRPFSLENLLFLAKGSWKVKNLKQCMWLAKKSRLKLHIAGGRNFIPSRYIKPYGMVGGSLKLELLQSTDALLFPVRWHEPFGIAIIEAMACGSPVFGSSYGSLPELIKDSCGGVFTDRESLLAHLLGKPKYVRKDIREYVEESFSIERLTDDYLRLYEKILSGKSLNEVEPTWRPERPPLELLDF